MASNFTTMTNLKDYPQIVSLMEDANHIDVKVVEGSVSLRQFIAGMLSYYPWWLRRAGCICSAVRHETACQTR
jgi:hypothetical protein